MSQGVIYVEDDGVDHIRMHVNGQTKLGRYLANSAQTPFRHPKFGSFQSLEGFWQFLGSGCKEEFRKVSGRLATLVGHNTSQIRTSNFRDNILSALRCKIEQTDCILDMLEHNDIPFALYEIDDTGSVITHNDWFVQGLGDIIKDSPWLNGTPRQPTMPLSIKKRVRWTETVVT